MASCDGRPRRGRFFFPSAAATVAYTLLLVFATHYPKPELLLGRHAPSDKTLHFIAYGILGLLAAATLATSGRWSAARAGGLATALAVFGAADEITQPWFSRAAEPLDWVCDCLGIAGGVLSVAAAMSVAALVALRRGRMASAGRGQ